MDPTSSEETSPRDAPNNAERTAGSATHSKHCRICVSRVLSHKNERNRSEDKKKGGCSLTIADTEGVGATAQKGHNSLVNTYQSPRPNRRFNRVSRLGVIVIFAILTPPDMGVGSRTEQARLGPFPLEYISRIDSQHI